MRLFRSRSEIVLKFKVCVGIKLVLTNIILLTIYQIKNWTISDVLHEIFHQIIFILPIRE